MEVLTTVDDSRSLSLFNKRRLVEQNPKYKYPEALKSENMRNFVKHKKYC
jgi:hypothetical protein